MNKVLVAVGLILVLLVAVIGYFVFGKKSRGDKTQPSAAKTQPAVSWVYEGAGWRPTGSPPPCPNPLVLQPPIDLTKVTSIMYPGQIRGGDYKAHGGFRLDESKDGEITVTAPITAIVTSASRYLEEGEVQYLFHFINPCGIAYRFDHLRVLSPTLQRIADQLPQPKPDDSRTTELAPIEIKAGDTIATAIGFVKTNNFGFDWGVYDLRTKNAASKDPTWAAAHDPGQAHHALCWLDLLGAAESTLVKNLPGGDQALGKTSDYCN